MIYSEETHLKIIDELENDFMTELEKIDFSDYRPDSAEFMYPVTIGMMHKLLKDLSEDDHIQEEIDGGWEYLKCFKRTGNSAYKEMASDELKHARILIGIHRVKYPNKSFVNYEKEIAEIQAQL